MEKKSRRKCCGRLAHSIKEKFDSAAGKTTHSSYKCKCPWICWRMVSHELKNNNQLYHLFSVESVVAPRSLRLALLFLSVLTELAISAFFHDLSPSDESSSFDSETLTENFWVGLYSVVLTLVLMSLVGLALRIPSKWLKQLTSAASSRSVVPFPSFNKKLKIRLGLAFVVWFLLSGFLCLYLMGFCEIASGMKEEEWMTSSLISIAIDMSAFEVLPALLFASLGLLIVFCKMKWVMCGVVILETYRAVRNVVSL